MSEAKRKEQQLPEVRVSQFGEINDHSPDERCIRWTKTCISSLAKFSLTQVWSWKPPCISSVPAHRGQEDLWIPVTGFAGAGDRCVFHTVDR